MLMHLSTNNTSIERSGRISAILSLACAIHCALMPLVITLLPLVGMQFLASHTVEFAMLAFGLGFGGYGVFKGYRSHRNRRPLAAVMLGSILVLTGLFLVPEAWEPFLVSSGALLVGIAQVMNIRANRVCKTC